MIIEESARLKAESYQYMNILDPTPSESRLKIILNQMGVVYELEKIFFYSPVNFYLADFYIPSKNLVIELDWSSHIGKEEYDKKRDEWFKSQWISVLRVKNENVDWLWKLFARTKPVIVDKLKKVREELSKPKKKKRRKKKGYVCY